MNTEILHEISQKFGTPCFVLDLDAFNERIKKISQLCTDKIDLCYAIKANTYFAKRASEHLQRLEVCSQGELEICIRQGVDMAKIIFSGVNKEQKTVLQAAKQGVRIFTVESLAHLEYINNASLEIGAPLSVLLRLSSGNQFGIDKSAIVNIVQNTEQYKTLSFIGIHFFSGTQKKSEHEVIAELELLEKLHDEMQAKYNFTIKEFEYGTGLSVPYFDKNNFTDTLSPLKAVIPALLRLAQKCKITIEMGRFFAAECAKYITAINDIKTNDGVNYAIVDGGINHVNYYGQTMAMKKPIIQPLVAREGERMTYTLCGSLCTTADVLVRNMDFTFLCKGDIMVFNNIGAYSLTEGMYLFLSRDMPKIVAYSQTNGVELLRDTICTHLLNG